MIAVQQGGVSCATLREDNGQGHGHGGLCVVSSMCVVSLKLKMEAQERDAAEEGAQMVGGDSPGLEV